MRLAKGYTFAGAPAAAVQISRTNPLCGDRCTLYVQFRNGKVVHAAHDTRGCVLCLAAGETLLHLAQDMPHLTQLTATARALVSAMATGSPLPPPLQHFTPVQARPSRHECVLLPYNALIELAENKHTDTC